MAASWHTMAVISCPVFFCSHHWFLLGINTLVLGGKLGSSWPPPHTVGLQTGPPARIPRVWPFLHLLWNVTKALWRCKGKENLANMRRWGTAVACSPYTAKKRKEGLGSYSLPGFGCVNCIVLLWSGFDQSEMGLGHTFPPPLSIHLSLLQIATITASHVAWVENGGKADTGRCNCISFSGLISSLMALFAATEYDNENWLINRFLKKTRCCLMLVET